MNHDKLIKVMATAFQESAMQPVTWVDAKRGIRGALKALQGEMAEESAISIQSQGHTVTYNNTSNAKELYNELKNLKEEE